MSRYGLIFGSTLVLRASANSWNALGAVPAWVSTSVIDSRVASIALPHICATKLRISSRGIVSPTACCFPAISV